MAERRFTKAEVDSLLDRGMDADSIFTLEQRGYAGRLPDLLGPPRPGEENLRSRLLGTLPAVGAGSLGLATGILTRSPWLAAAGGATGAAGGRMLENVGREAMGLPRREGMTERAIESRGEQVPELLGRAMDVGEQALGGGVLEGGSAALLGAAPARGTGAIAQGLEAWSKRSKASTAAKNVERGRALREAGRVPAATLQRLALEAEAEKGAAGRAKADILRTAPGDLIPIGAIIDRVRKNMAGQIGATPDRGRIAKRVKERFAAVIEAASEGAISGRKTTYNVRELDWAKTRFDRAARGKISESTKGIAHDPDMDEQIANALREEVAERVPEIVPANLAYQGAREATIGARKRLARETSPSFQRQREAEDLARDEAMRQATMLGNVEPLLNPTLGMRGQVWFHPPRLGTLLHRGADILGHPAVTRTGRVAPETLNLLLRLAEPEWNPELNRR